MKQARLGVEQDSPGDTSYTFYTHEGVKKLIIDVEHWPGEAWKDKSQGRDRMRMVNGEGESLKGRIA